MPKSRIIKDTSEFEQAITEVLEAAFPDFRRPEFHGIRDQLVKEVLQMFAVLTPIEQREETRLEVGYKEFEDRFLERFLSALPGVSGPLSAYDKDIFERNIEHALIAGGVDLQPDERTYLLESCRDAFKMYIGLAKVNLNLATSVYERRMDNAIDRLKGLRRRKENHIADEQVRDSLTTILRLIDPEFREIKVQRFVDQMMWLFEDVVVADEAKRQDVYAKGEERILISLFDSKDLPMELRAS